MNSIKWLEVLSGFGVFLFSLRILNNVLDRSIAKRLRPLVGRFLATSWQCVGLGFFSTLLLQASSITIIGAMGLLNSGLVTLEQSYLIMLGSTIGTTIKIWILTENINNYALILVSLGSIALIISRNPLIRDFWEILLAIGLAFFGFNMMVIALLPLSQNPTFINLLEIYDGHRFYSQFLGIITGCILTMAVQSGSTFVFLVIGLAQGGVIPFNAGAAFILGANIGTTSTALIVSLEHSADVRRLAVGHFVVKTLGVFVSLLCFPYFLAFVDLLIPGSSSENISYHLAGVHTIFNIFNVIFWVTFSSFMLKFLYFAVPGDGDNKTSSLSNTVRKMITGNPEISLQEIEIQRKNIELFSQKFSDYSFDLLISGMKPRKRYNVLELMRKDFENTKDCLQELLLKVSKHDLSDEKQNYIQQQLQFLVECTNFYHQVSSLCSHLERGLLLDRYGFPAEIQQHWQTLQRCFNELWVIVFLKKPADKYDRTQIQLILDSVQRWYFSSLAKDKNVKYEYLAWAYETLVYFAQIEKQLFTLCKK